MTEGKRMYLEVSEILTLLFFLGLYIWDRGETVKYYKKIIEGMENNK